MAGPLVILDEDVPGRAATAVLAAGGYDVRTVVGQGWGGTPDEKLWPLVQQLNAFSVTADKGFADVRVCPPGTHAGLLLLRPDVEGVVHFARLLQLVLDQNPLAQLTAAVVVATDRGIRIRGAPSVRQPGAE